MKLDCETLDAKRKTPKAEGRTLKVKGCIGPSLGVCTVETTSTTQLVAKFRGGRVGAVEAKKNGTAAQPLEGF